LKYSNTDYSLGLI